MDSAPLNYFLHSEGPAARPTLLLDWVFTGIVTAVCIITALLLLWAIFRKRAAIEPNVLLQGGHGLRWVGVGTGVSTVILFAMAVYALITLNQSAITSVKPALTITVTGYDWWWKADYNEDNPKSHFSVANEIHIPVGVPVRIKLKSADVIHAFWVPMLAGKTQMIPGLINQQWLQADTAGRYRGQCTQFCGMQHAHMAFEVVAESQADFSAWQAAQHQPATLPDSPQAVQGQQVFQNQCAGCHAVQGTKAAGGHAPDLTHVNSRQFIGAGMLTNTPEHVMQWVAHVQEIKPGALMPDVALSTEDASALSSYLSTLK